MNIQITVSYTHLDVYKRQLHTLAAKYIRRTNQYRVTKTVGNLFCFLCSIYGLSLIHISGVNVLTAIDTAKALVTSLEDTDHKNLTLIDIARL